MSGIFDGTCSTNLFAYLVLIVDRQRTELDRENGASERRYRMQTELSLFHNQRSMENKQYFNELSD